MEKLLQNNNNETIESLKIDWEERVLSISQVSLFCYSELGTPKNTFHKSGVDRCILQSTSSSRPFNHKYRCSFVYSLYSYRIYSSLLSSLSNRHNQNSLTKSGSISSNNACDDSVQNVLGIITLGYRRILFSLLQHDKTYSDSYDYREHPSNSLLCAVFCSLFECTSFSARPLQLIARDELFIPVGADNVFLIDALLVGTVEKPDFSHIETRFCNRLQLCHRTSSGGDQSIRTGE